MRGEGKPMSGPSRVEPEFSRPIVADTVSNQTQRREISAEPGERAGLARRFGLVALDSLGAVLELRREAGGTIHMSGRLAADVVQSCVVTLAPVSAHIESDFEIDYGAAADLAAGDDFDPLGPDAPEPIVDGRIDLGEALAQQLAIVLDPYPRVPGATFDTAAPAPDGKKSSGKQPFAVLAALKKRL